MGSESSQASSGRGGGVARRWRSGASANNSNNPAGITKGSALIAGTGTTLPGTAKQQPDVKHCEDCEQRIEPLIIDRYYFKHG